MHTHVNIKENTIQYTLRVVFSSLIFFFFAGDVDVDTDTPRRLHIMLLLLFLFSFVLSLLLTLNFSLACSVFFEWSFSAKSHANCVMHRNHLFFLQKIKLF